MRQTAAPAPRRARPLSQLRAALAPLALLLAADLLVACADASGDVGGVSDLEKRSSWEEEDAWGEQEASADEQVIEWWSEDSSAPAEESAALSEATQESDLSQEGDVSQEGALPEVRFGGACAPGCVWSAYAVTSGAQEAGASCEGFLCACVLRDDVSALCAPDSPSAPADAGDVSGEPQTPTSTQGPYGADYSADLGRRIADAAYTQATRRNTIGYCYGAVADAVESVLGAFLYGASAYMAADQLAAHPRFAEVSVSDLTGLPAGAVVVWGRGTSAHGHISVALGDGREASDHIAPQMVYHYGGAPARVFLPR